MATYRILSLDGGGTWALLQAMALEDLFPGQSGRRILGQFDMAVACSGGSIVLAGLMLDMTPGQIRGLFEVEANRRSVFVAKPVNSLLNRLIGVLPKYNASRKQPGLLRLMHPHGGRPLRDWPALPEWPRGPRGDPLKAMIVGFDYDALRSEFFRTFATPAGRPASEISLADAVHASTNAPVVYFDEPADCLVQVSPARRRRYWDGAMAGYNNPVLAGVVEALSRTPGQTAPLPAEIRALCIGTGTVRLVPPDATPPPPKHFTQEPARVTIIGDAARAARSVTNDPPDAATYVAHVMLGHPVNSAGGVVRLNPVIAPLLDGAQYRYPGGLTAEQFARLSRLDMDALKDEQVALIRSLGAAWIAGGVTNQAIRSGGVGHATYGAARAHWFSVW